MDKSKMEKYAEIQAMVQKEARDIAEQVYKENANRYGVAKVPLHYHNGIDSPFLINPAVTYIGFIPYDGGEYTVQTTGSISGGATSATLVNAWNGSGVFTVTFSNGQQKSVTFTDASTAITWTGGLSSGASSTLTVGNPLLQFVLPGSWASRRDDTGVYTITHNLGEASNINFYSVVASATQSTNVYVTPVVSLFENEVTLSWGYYDYTTLANIPVDTSFTFQLVTGNNRSPIKTQYTTRNFPS